MTELLISTLVLIFLLDTYYVVFLIRIISGLKNLSRLSNHYEKKPDEFVSVVVPFRNESENIVRCLKSLEEQNYFRDKFEMIFINDFSDDDSLVKLCSNKKLENVRILSLPDSLRKISSKKTAVRYGIENSNGNIIVTTDADCVHSSNWLQSLVNSFDYNTGVVAGPVQFEEETTIFQKMQKIEFQSLIFSGAGLIGIEKPVICNAANFAFRKDLFFKLGGFDDNINISSGDDVFIMQKIAHQTKYKVKFCMKEDCIVKTKSSKNFKEFFEQRKRWAGKINFYYDKLFVLSLVSVFLFYLTILIQLILGIFITDVFLLTFLFSFLLKILMDFFVLRKGYQMLNQRLPAGVFLLAEFFHIPYIILSILGGFLGNYSWKGRITAH